MNKVFKSFISVIILLAVSTHIQADNTIVKNGLAFRILPNNEVSVAYNGVLSLDKIDIPESIDFKFESYSVSEIEKGAFRGSEMSAILIPSSVKKIGSMAFAECPNLLSINLPEGIDLIDDATFDGCQSLESVSIPSSVKKIGMWAFRNCLALQSITLPINLSSIEDAAFEGCKNLRLLTIPNSVRNIGNLAFNNCSSLRHVTLPSSLLSLNFGILNGCDLNSELTVPASVKEMNDIGKSAKLRSIFILGDTIYDGLKRQSLYNGKRISIYVKRSIYDAGIYQNDTSWTSKFAFGYTIPLNMKSSFITMDMGNGNYRKVSYISLCRDFDVDFSDPTVTNPNCKAFYAADISYDRKEVAMKQINYIHANDGYSGNYQGVIVEGSPNAEYYYMIGEGNSNQSNSIVDENMLRGVHTERLITSREKNPATGESFSNYGLKDNLFKQFNQDGIMSYNKAYLSIPDIFANAKDFNMRFDGNDITSYVIPIQNLSDLMEESFYNLNGQKLDYKQNNFLYIKRGKKFINK